MPDRPFATELRLAELADANAALRRQVAAAERANGRLRERVRRLELEVRYGKRDADA